MAPTRTLDSRWVRRYRAFFIVGSVILSIQVFLAYKFFPIDADGDESAQEHRDLSGKGVNIEVVNEDLNGGVSSRRFKENYLVVDDEDSPSNSNPVNGLYIRNKVPPDKSDSMLSNRNNAAAVEKVPKLNNKDGGSPGQNRTSLRLEELDFVPACDIVAKEAISAIHRAKTQLCKQKLANITCLIQQRQLYPHHLPNSCPSPGFTAGKSLGCYRDEKTFRLLSGYYANLKTTNSPKHCINMCLQSGFPYAGVQYSTECFCGIEEPPSTSRLPDSSCNMKCPADPREACGGFFTINVYETGIAKFTPQVPREVAESGESPVRIAFLLTLNGRALRQVRRLIKVLFHRDHFFYIHVDARQDYLFRELLVLERSLPNVRLARNRYATIWGGASLLQMLLTSMNELLESGWEWDFVINLSESDFPVKTNQQLVDFLTANKGRNFVKSHGREVQRFIQKQGLDKTFVECDAHMWRTGDRRLPWGIQMDGGSDWVALSRPFVAYVATAVQSNYLPEDPLVEGLNTIFKHTLLPAESFFHTALRNSHFCDTYVDNNLHVTNWKRRLGCKCQYKHVVDWCGCSPNDFKPEDWPRLQGTENRQLFFARKFEPVINQAIIDQVEDWLYGPYPSNLANVKSYWQSVYHYADLSPPPDDSLVTLAASLSRLSSKSIALKPDGNGCFVQPGKVIEVTSYHNNDNYKGSLVLYEALLNGGTRTVVFETWVQPQHYMTILKEAGLGGRVKSLLISSDYDQKEQMSRNFLHNLGPFSEPTLVYQLGVNSQPSTYNVTFLWVDPAGQLVEVSEVHMEDGHATNYVKPLLREPLLPGVWTVKMVYDAAVVAQTQFLVTPLQFVSGANVSQQQAGFLHSGPGQSYAIHDTTDWEKLLDNKADRSALQRKALVNSRRFGLDLRDWIDNLNSKFYKVLDTCVASATSHILAECGKLHLELCERTAWSSLAPDPKSRIGMVNLTTGRLNRW
ncbi:xylosyltransferase oxt [Periplaneta americana]|uniref:xylosyltransferase oxt n=1 Tax=Periplaneta americana TaxID=6978 RepID=UPI0037E78CA0